MEKAILIRDDDVSAKTEKFAGFFRLAAGLGIPVNYAAIPAKLDTSASSLLNSASRQQINVTVHGFTHSNHSKNPSIKYEFGERRSFAEQKEDIANGKRIISQKIRNSLITNIFTPPYHGYDENTLRAVSLLGFRGISSPCSRRICAAGLTNISIHINGNIYSGDTVRMIEKGRLMLEIESRKHQDFVGINIHHETLSENELKGFFSVMQYYRKKGYRFLLMNDLLENGQYQ